MTKFKTILAAIGAVAVAVFATATPASALAVSDPYLGVGASASVVAVGHFNLDDGSAIDAVGGATVAVPHVGPVRFEGRVARVSQNTNLYGMTLQANAIQYGVNAFRDFPLGASPITPYVGAGFQWTTATVGVPGYSQDANGWGFNVAGGARTKLTSNVSLDTGVRFGRNWLDFGNCIGTRRVDDAQFRVGLDIAV